MRVFVFLAFFILPMFLFAQEDAAPDFNLPELDGNNYQLSENFGKGPILINFWATWCIPCREEMKKLKEIFEMYEDDGLQVLSISIDDTKTVSKVKSFVRTNRYPFTILLDTNSEVFQLYQGTNPPLTYLLNTDGEIVYSNTGYRKGDEKKLEEKIADLVQTE